MFEQLPQNYRPSTVDRLKKEIQWEEHRLARLPQESIDSDYEKMEKEMLTESIAFLHEQIKVASESEYPETAIRVLKIQSQISRLRMDVAANQHEISKVRQQYPHREPGPWLDQLTQDYLTKIQDSVTNILLLEAQLSRLDTPEGRREVVDELRLKVQLYTLKVQLEEKAVADMERVFTLEPDLVARPLEKSRKELNLVRRQLQAVEDQLADWLAQEK
jgi:hypothetical protein